jgi:predicted metal-dependent enzyme (double-stranded beta helix superfamily)
MHGLDSSDVPHTSDLDTRLSPNELRAITSHLAGQEDFWRPHGVNEPNMPSRARVLWSPRVEIWLIGWDPDSSMDAHDHGGATGAFTVCEGTIDTHERSLTAPHDGVRQRALRTGDSVTFDADHVHEIVNRSGAPAITIHAYSPALTTVTFYAPIADELLPVRRAEVSDPDSSVIATPVGAGRG